MSKPKETVIESLAKEVESLTAERDELKKRVGELEIENGLAKSMTDMHIAMLERQERELQAARRLAESISEMAPLAAQIFDSWHNDGTSWSEWDESVRVKLSLLMQQARDFLKMLDSQAPASTPPEKQ